MYYLHDLTSPTAYFQVDIGFELIKAKVDIFQRSKTENGGFFPSS